MHVKLALLLMLLTLSPAMADAPQQVEEPALSAVSTPPSQANITAPVPSPSNSCDENDYPDSALQDKAEGTTTVRLLIGADGKILDVFVVASSGREDLDKASVLCARNWHYQPARKDGVQLIAEVQRNIIWQMK